MEKCEAVLADFHLRRGFGQLSSITVVALAQYDTSDVSGSGVARLKEFNIVIRVFFETPSQELMLLNMSFFSFTMLFIFSL